MTKNTTAVRKAHFFLFVVFFVFPILSHAAIVPQTAAISGGDAVLFSGIQGSNLGRGNGHLFLWAYNGTGTTTISGTPYTSLGASWGASGTDVWTFNFGCSLPDNTSASCSMNTIFAATANALPAGNYQVELQDTVYSSGDDYLYTPMYWSGYQWTTGAGIDFSQYYSPIIFDASSSAIAASSSLWGAYASSTQVAVTCNTTNNPLDYHFYSGALCEAFNFILVPNPNTLNQFFALPTIASSRFPFSWIYGVQSEVGTLTASSTSNMVDLQFNFASLDPASSTPMGTILPNFSGFSSSTITQYVGASEWSFFQYWIAAALWLGLIVDIFFTAKRLAQPH